jgi:hypothetical protein
MVHVRGTRRVSFAYLGFCVRVMVIIISHRCQFIIFGDPLMTSHWLHDALMSWLDQRVAPTRRAINKTLVFNGMSPAEAELTFDLSDLRFRDCTRIAVIQHPFRRMAQLYDRIAATDPLWRLRRRAGWGPCIWKMTPEHKAQWHMCLFLSRTTLAALWRRISQRLGGPADHTFCARRKCKCGSAQRLPAHGDRTPVQCTC